jgi:hypothetical protein
VFAAALLGDDLNPEQRVFQPVAAEHNDRASHDQARLGIHQFSTLGLRTEGGKAFHLDIQ